MTYPLRLRKAINTLKWEYEKQRLTLDCLAGKYRRNGAHADFTIGIVTYIVRFPMFKALLEKVRKAFPQTRIVVAVNGYYKPESQREYLEEIAKFAGRLRDVTLIPHMEPQGLCALWNRIILAAKTEKIFIMNDDLDIAPRFRDAFISSGILDREMAIINQSWSHFVISKRTVERVGWFDERLYGIGGEDWDYEARLALTGVPLEIVPVKGVLNMSVYTTEFSFGENVERVHDKYTMSTAVFIRQKWDISGPDDPEARFVRIWNNYVRLNPGFETPVFYDFALLRSEKGEAGEEPPAAFGNFVSGHAP